MNDGVFAVDLKLKRREKNLTQQELADIIGYTRETVSRVENRTDALPMAMAVRCAKEFGCITAQEGDRVFVISATGNVRPSGTDDEDTRTLRLVGSDKRVGRPSGLGMPVKCMTVLREVGQLSDLLENLHHCMLDIELGKAGARERLVALVKEAQEAYLWIAVLLLHTREKHPEVHQQGTEAAWREVCDHLGYEIAEEVVAVA